VPENPPRKSPLPTRQQLIDFITENPEPMGQREIARAFGLRGADRARLRQMLTELESDGLIDQAHRQRIREQGHLPSVTILEVDFIDEDGEVYCRPARESEAAIAPTIHLVQGKGKSAGPAPGEGDRILARIRRTSVDSYEARPIRILADGNRIFLGLYQDTPAGGMVRPVSRRGRDEFRVEARNRGGAKDGDFVRVETLSGGKRGARHARVLERVARRGEPGSISLIALHEHRIPIEFPEAALAEAEAAAPPTPDGRTDLRAIPLVTIDGPDARDFDDAVWAEPDSDKDNPDGWHAIVAIADVANYVRSGSALDDAAHKRGNSVYLPDRAIPMLPEQLSNGLCSLRPGEDRACLAVHLTIDREGLLQKHTFVRGIMQSAARLTYEQVQNGRDGRPDDTTGPLLDTVIQPLYGVYEALRKARAARGTLEIDLPERQVVFDSEGHVEAIVPRLRHDSHRLIEELMIAANVAAAETLHRLDTPAMRRIHDPPDPEALADLRKSLEAFGLKLTKTLTPRPAALAGILAQAANTEFTHIVSDLVLRCQSQAFYGPFDRGHFGLALRRYSHFTSPIRRYADLLVHRALIERLSLGSDGEIPDDSLLEETGEHISETERRAAMAERGAMDRYATEFLAERVGTVFAGRVSGVTHFGLFIRLDDTGVDGLIPVRTLPTDWYDHDEVGHRLTGESSGIQFTLGDAVTVRLTEADAAAGRLTFELVEGGRIAKKEPRRRRGAKRRQPKRPRRRRK
jgi:ribonuclease R